MQYPVQKGFKTGDLLTAKKKLFQEIPVDFKGDEEEEEENLKGLHDIRR